MQIVLGAPFGRRHAAVSTSLKRPAQPVGLQVRAEANLDPVAVCERRSWVPLVPLDTDRCRIVYEKGFDARLQIEPTPANLSRGDDARFRSLSMAKPRVASTGATRLPPVRPRPPRYRIPIRAGVLR